MSADHQLQPDDEVRPRGEPAAWAVTSARDVEGETFPSAAGFRAGAPERLGELPQDDDMRHKLQDRLADAAFPATRNDLLRHIGPDTRGQLAAHLRSLPPDVVFADVDAVVNAFGAVGNIQ